MSDNPRSLRNNNGFRDFVLDQLATLDVTAKSMFGGTGLYARDRFFGIIARDHLYLKVDASSRQRYEEAGMGPFRPYPDRGGTMQYYEVPLSILESGVDLQLWAKEAVSAAARATATESSPPTPRAKSKARASRARTRR